MQHHLDQSTLPPGTEPCAVIRAGDSILLALLARAGRFPIEVTSTDDTCIRWVSKDGTAEQIVLSGKLAQQEHQLLCNELRRGELLVAEVNDLSEIDTPDASYWLIGAQAPCRQERERSA